jgi:hypothetical protein
MNSWLKLSIICFLAFIIMLFMVINVSRAENWVDEMNNTTYFPPDPMTSYHYKEPGEWTNWNRFWFGSAIATFGVGDTVSTMSAIDSDHCVEGNPIYGDDPDAATLALTKIAIFGAMWWLTEYATPPEERQNTRNFTYGILSVAGAGLTVHNYSLDCN